MATVKAATAAPQDVTPKKVIMSPDLKAEQESLYRQEYERDSAIVRGKFIFHEVPGGSFAFPYKKYKWDVLKTYKMQDGEIYSVPLGVAKHLNTNCSYPTYKYKNDEQGRPQMSLGENVRRCSFQSLEFLDLK